MKYTLLFSPSEGVRYADRQRLHTKNRAKVQQILHICKFFFIFISHGHRLGRTSSHHG